MGYAERATAELHSRLVGMKAAVDVQHVYRGPPHAGDRGSRYVTRGGLVVWEAQAAVAYAQALVAWLRDRGAAVLTNEPLSGILTGPYTRRGAAAGAWGAHLYLACHVNAGGGGYGMGEYLVGTPGQPVADAIGGVLVTRFAEIPAFKANPIVAGQRGAVCVEAFPRTRPAVILEPFFGDTPSMQPLLLQPRLNALGEAIGEGVAVWWNRQPKGIPVV